MPMSLSKNYKHTFDTKRIFAFVFYFLLILKTLESFVLMSHGDALSYHLVLGKFILEDGFYKAHKEFYLGNMTGIFDYLYILPQWLFGSFIKAQMASQFFHFLFSLVGGVFLFSKVFREKIIFYSAGICLLTFARGPDFFIYAKNDGPLALTFLVGTLLVFRRVGEGLSPLRRHILIGLCLGLLPAIKMSGVIYAAILGLTYVFKNLKEFKLVALATMISLAVASIIWIRNWYFVGNPLFPAFLNLFPTKATPEMITFMESFLKQPGSLLGVFKNFIIAISPKAVGFLVIPACFYNYTRKKGDRNQILFLLLGFTALYCTINPGYPAERFYFPCHFILFFYLGETLKDVSKETWWNPNMIYLLFLIFLADSKVDKVTKRVFSFYRDVVVLGDSKSLLYKWIPHTKIWNKVKRSAKIISDLAPMQYYTPKNVRLYQVGHSEQANFLYGCKVSFHKELEGFDYYIVNVRVGNCKDLPLYTEELLFNQDGYALFKL